MSLPEVPLSIFLQIKDNQIIVSGQTYPLRNQLKALGARFAGIEKNWVLPFSEENKKQAEELCQSSGGRFVSEVISSAPLAVQPFELLEKIRQGAENMAVSDRSVFVDKPVEEKKVFSLFQVMSRLEETILHNFPQAIWITGEIQNIANKGTGVFLTLADQHPLLPAQSITVQGVVWKDRLQAIFQKQKNASPELVLKDGMKICALCQVRFYKNRSSISLEIWDIDCDYTLGSLALSRENLVRELKAKNLYAANKQKTIPHFLFRIGLITAEGSRAYSDFTHQLESLGFCGTVIFQPAAMQGDQSLSQVPKALKKLEQANCDLIVITRGGGSAADLYWFNQPEIVYAIAKSPCPILSAIGHHDDQSVCEEVSFLCQKTPTAAASYIVDQMTRQREYCAQLMRNMEKAMNTAVLGFEKKQKILLERIRIQAVERGLNQWLKKNLALKNKLDLTVTRTLHAFEKNCEQLYFSLAKKDPTPWLAKGWTQLYKADKSIKSINELTSGDELRARLLDGNIEVIVKHIVGKQNNE